ncbi:uncharacterized protein LOC143462167 [Clavelina lepadiformis]|uniref:uncharacterized protein LOC143462167 n=1 Tax=Clavelina lepadiformis TaxID=159417 RepID=UPI004041ED68
MAAVKDGYLQKYSSGIFKGWKRKYFVLYNDGHFVIFDYKGGTRAASYLVSRDCRDIQVGAGIQAKVPHLPNGQSIDCVFLFIARDKRFLLLADNRRELDSWMQALNNCRATSSSGATSTGYPAMPIQPQYPSTSSHPGVIGAPGGSVGYNNFPAAPPNNMPYYNQPSGLPAQPPPYTGPQQGNATLGFENLTLGSSHQNPPYPSQTAPGYQQPPQPPTQGYPANIQQPSYPYGQPMQPYSGAPCQHPPGGYPAQAYPQPAAYGQPSSHYYSQPQQTQVYAQPHKSGGSGLGGLGGILTGGGLGAALGGVGKTGKKHKKLLGGTAAALAGGYVLHKATRRGSWGSWGSGCSFGSFGSFGSCGS